MKSSVAETWLEALAGTANARDYAAHMDLISKDAKVFGVPGFDLIDYDDWANQCRHEFEQGLLKRVTYRDLRVVAMTPGRVMFKTMETVEGTDGTVNVNGVEIVIQKEADGKCASRRSACCRGKRWSSIVRGTEPLTPQRREAAALALPCASRCTGRYECRVRQGCRKRPAFGPPWPAQGAFAPSGVCFLWLLSLHEQRK